MRNRTIFFSVLALVTVFVVSLTGLVLVTLSYTPRELGPAAITFWFLGVLVMVLSLCTLIDYSWKMRKDDNRMQPKKALISSLRTGFLLGFTAALLLALSSLKSLTLRDIILFALTVLIIELYFRTRKTRSKP